VKYPLHINYEDNSNQSHKLNASSENQLR